MRVVTVLFVDDEVQVLQGLKRLLHTAVDYQIRVASSGEEAVSMLTAEAIDVIVTDLRMPGMDGFTLLTYAREHFPRVKRILLSGSARVNAVSAAQVILTKPCDRKTLLGVIHQLMNASS